jgi:hypothetical protein
MSAIDPGSAPATEADPAATVTVHPDALRHALAPDSRPPRSPEPPAALEAPASGGIPLAVLVGAIIGVLMLALLIGLAVT